MEFIEYNTIKLAIPKRYAVPLLMDRFQKNTYEKEELQLLSLFTSSDTVLELGSCLGYMTHQIATHVHCILGIEANPELQASLEETRKLNGYTNVQFIHCIVDPTKEWKDFKTFNLVVAGSADRNDLDNDPNKKSYKVPCKTIQQLEHDVGCKFNCLFIDIEGGELLFLEQHKSYIKESIQKVILELHGRFMPDKEFNTKCIHLLQECGFHMIKKNGNSYSFSK